MGHFIYGLKDRIWPDFVCHFSLFRPGVHAPSVDTRWHWDQQNPEVTSRSPVASKTKLSFLHNNVLPDATSLDKLEKAGFFHQPDHSGKPEPSSAATIRSSQMTLQVSL